MTFSDLFGNSLIKGKTNETLETNSHLQGKNVLVYFSAHWCPPCRAFTPKLSEFYQNNQTNIPFEIVFASADNGQESFDEYFGEMPWTAIPFSEREVFQKLSEKFEIEGYPSLISLDSEGKIINPDVVGKVRSNPDGAGFPWPLKNISEIVTGKLISKNGELDASELKGKYHAIYFSAHWCPPCKFFTPTLADYYKKVLESGKEFEVVFASFDRDEEQYNEYYASMPWASFGFDDERTKDLSEILKVNSIPALVLFTEDGEIFSKSGTVFVRNDPEGKDFPWKHKLLQDMSFCTNEHLSKTCVIGISDDFDFKPILTPLAEENETSSTFSANEIFNR